MQPLCAFCEVHLRPDCDPQSINDMVNTDIDPWAMITSSFQLRGDGVLFIFHL